MKGTKVKNAPTNFEKLSGCEGIIEKEPPAKRAAQINDIFKVRFKGKKCVKNVQRQYLIFPDDSDEEKAAKKEEKGFGPEAAKKNQNEQNAKKEEKENPTLPEVSPTLPEVCSPLRPRMQPLLLDFNRCKRIGRCSMLIRCVC